MSQKDEDNDDFQDITERSIQLIDETEQRITHENFIKSLHELSVIISEREKIHTYEEIKNEKLRKLISYPSMIFTGSSFVSMLSWASSNSRLEECKPDLWFSILNTILTLISLLLVSSRDFFKIDTKTFTNSTGAERLRSLYYTVEDYKKIKYGKEGDRIQIIQSLRKQYHMIVRKNPPITRVLNFNIDPHLKIDSIDEKCESPADVQVSEKLESNRDTISLEMKYRFDRLDNV